MSNVENYRSSSAHDPGLDDEIEVDEAPYDHELDSPASQALHRKLMDWFDQTREAHAENRMEMALDEAFYDGEQWSDSDALTMLERGQAPLVFNLIKPAVDWISGTEKRTRIDFNVLPKRDDSHNQESARNKLKLLKHISDSNKAQFHRSDAFKSAVIVGVGWLETGVRNDHSDEPVYYRCENWRNVWWDHLSVERDLSDARYLFRTRWVDLDIAEALFPDRKEALRLAAFDRDHEVFGDDEWLGNRYDRRFWDERTEGATVRQSFSNDPQHANTKRDRTRLIECWYRQPKRTTVLRGDTSHACCGEEFNALDTRHAQALSDGILSTYDGVIMTMRVAIMTEKHLLQEMRSPYRHNEFTFTPIWGYRRGKDGMPYGAVRPSRDPQEDMNKRQSKALHILSTAQIIADKNAVDDWDEAADEAARPDGIIKVRGDARFEITTDRNLAQQHIDLMLQDREFINNISGVTGENLGLDSNAVSGKAILAKQTQGSVVTFELFDNLRFALQLNGEKLLSLTEQWYDAPKLVRLLGESGKTEFTSINQREVDPITGQTIVKNDITRTRSDFVVDSQDFRQTVRQAMFEQMLNMMKTLPPEISISMLDLVVDLSDLPGKDALVERLRKINGQTAPGEQETPEQAAQRMAQEEAARVERELAQRKLASEIGEREARTKKLNIETQDLAMDAGAKAALAGPTAGAADSLLRSAGYTGG